VPPLLLVAILLAVIAVIPTRRLAIRGASNLVIAAYFAALWLSALAIVAAPGRSRILVPVVVVLAIVPFVTLRDGLDRLMGRPPREVSPPPRNVTPPDATGAGTGPS
jgi:hypothetical protein